MPVAIPSHRPRGYQPARRRRTDDLDREYGTQRWRRIAKAVIERDGGICAFCHEPDADMADHIVEKRHGGTDDMSNLRAMHVGCHNTRHGRRGG